MENAIACNLSVSVLFARSCSTFGSKKLSISETGYCLLSFQEIREYFLIRFYHWLDTNCRLKNNADIYKLQNYEFASIKGYSLCFRASNSLQEAIGVRTPPILHPRKIITEFGRWSSSVMIIICCPVNKTRRSPSLQTSCTFETTLYSGNWCNGYK